ncbi:MAG: hypothetical protein DRR16_16860 [Candidatus Parabeggiatoa sp. nov. 3]|nr:MAG: hypothetical protein DRR00_31795 [Gammaproteobacteria bacterium]RKZ67930.1 MAG: hypothetical protein DRQ99_05190 [Gammaproteobacteria bacterium]RKZ83604.1 MAG: hypothetical protein DRR16_16860 [Gammaproteobacteria bacterium]
MLSVISYQLSVISKNEAFSILAIKFKCAILRDRLNNFKSLFDLETFENHYLVVRTQTHNQL